MIFFLKIMFQLVYIESKVDTSITDKVRKFCIRLGGVIAGRKEKEKKRKEKHSKENAKKTLYYFHEYGNFYKL